MSSKSSWLKNLYLLGKRPSLNLANILVPWGIPGHKPAATKTLVKFLEEVGLQNDLWPTLNVYMSNCSVLVWAILLFRNPFLSVSRSSTKKPFWEFSPLPLFLLFFSSSSQVSITPASSFLNLFIYQTPPPFFVSECHVLVSTAHLPTFSWFWKNLCHINTTKN